MRCRVTAPPGGQTTLTLLRLQQMTSFMHSCSSESLPGLWKCCVLGPEESACGMLGVCGVGGVCELCVRLVWTVEPGEDPEGDRFSSHSLDSLWKHRTPSKWSY